MKYQKKNSIRKTNKFLLIFSIIALSLIINTKYIRAEENKVVKVGYTIVDEFIKVENGIYSGYAYEYLREIAKHTGWEYEFIEMSTNELFYKLRDGEIDIVGGMIKNDQTIELYDFPEYNSGYTYTTLSALKNNENISQSNYYTLDGIKVGYFETSKKSLNKFVEFCKKNGIDDVELVPYPLENGKELFNALKSKEVDAIIGGDLLIDNEQKVIARFGGMPYYFATTKGNIEITKELNIALFKIKEDNPNFDEKLYNKYFQKYNDSSILLTEEEQEYISNLKPLKAVYINNYIPLENYNKNTQKPEGIFIDIINLIAQKSGLSFELVKADTYEEAYQMIKDKEADLIVGVPSEYLIADENDFVLTESFMKIDLVNVVNKKQQTQQGKKIIALPKGFAHAKIYDEDYEIKYYDTLEECLIAVRDGNANFTYGNTYTISSYMAAGYYGNLSLLLDKESGAAIGVSRPANKNLLSIINKVVYSLSEEEINNIIYENTINIKHPVTLKQFVFNNLTLSIIVIIFILSIIFTLIYIIVRMKFKHLKILLEKSQRDSLTGIYNRETFERLFDTYLEKKSPELYGALIIIDIDYFKQVNDTLGHKAGDELLKDFALLLKEVFSEKYIISRWGGDEFVVFMTDIYENNLDTINKKLKEICELMDKEVGDNDCRRKVSLSVGAVITKDEFNLDKLYQAADEMLYEVKRNGRNGFKIKETL